MELPSATHVLIALALAFTGSLQAQDGGIDPTFALSDIQGGSIATQSTGAVLLQVRSGSTRELVRLNPDGSLDSTFPADALDGNVAIVRTQSDDKILINGSFTKVGVTAVGPLVRLNEDGSLDPTFSRPAGSPFIGDFEVLASGKILGNLPDHGGLVRLNADGSVDPTFVIDPSLAFAQYPPFALLLDGGILVVSYPANSIPRVVRLTADGALDPSFQFPETALVNSAGLPQIAADYDGGVYVFGSTVIGDNLDPANYTPFVRHFLADGSVDASFTSPVLTGVPLTGSNTRPGIAVVRPEVDGKLVVGGNFIALNGVDEPSVARLNADGSVDRTFAAGGGQFTSANGVQPQVNDLLFQTGQLLVTGFLGGALTAGEEGTGIGTARLETGIVVIPPPASNLADLVGKVTGYKAKVSASNGKLKISGNLIVRNDGQVTAKKVVVAVFASTDMSPGSDDLKLGEIRLAEAGFKKIPRSGGKAGPIPFKYKVPASDAAAYSGKYLLIVLDSNHSVFEADEKNNVIVEGPLP